MIKKIPLDDFIDINLEKVELCGVCKDLNRVPCEHKRMQFRSKDRLDNIAEALNDIIDYINRRDITP